MYNNLQIIPFAFLTVVSPPGLVGGVVSTESLHMIAKRLLWALFAKKIDFQLIFSMYYKI